MKPLERLKNELEAVGIGTNIDGTDLMMGGNTVVMLGLVFPSGTVINLRANTDVADPEDAMYVIDVDIVAEKVT